MRQGVGVAILERQHLGVVQRLDGIAVDLLAAGSGSLGLGFFFGCQGFLGTELGNDGFALVGALDVHAGVFKIAHRQAVERQARGQPDFFIILAFIRLQALADQRSAHGAHELAGIGLGGFFPLFDLGIGQHEGARAVFVAAVHAQQLAAFHVVKQRRLLVGRSGRGLQPRQRSGDAIGLACGLHLGSQFVVALHVGAAGQGDAQNECAPQSGVRQWPEFHGCPCSELNGSTRKGPATPPQLQSGRSAEDAQARAAA